MGDDDELGRRGQAPQGFGEAADVGLVERRIDFVEHAERDRPDLEHGEQQRNGSQSALATRQHRQRLGLLARRPGHDLDAGRGEVGRVGQLEPGEAATEQLLEAFVERGLERPEGGLELVGDQRAELVDERAGSGDRRAQVVTLSLERLDPLAQLGVFLDRERIGRAELVEPPAERRQSAGRRRVAHGPGGFPGRHHVGQQRLELGALDVALGSAVALGSVRESFGSVRCRDRVVATVHRPDRLVGDVGQVGRGRAQGPDAEGPDAGQLDQDLLPDGVQAKPTFELGDLGGADSLVGGAQALPGGGRGGLDRAQLVAVGGIGAAQLVKDG